MPTRSVVSTLVVLLAAAAAAAQPRPARLDAPRPIDAADTVFIEEMTWMEVRDRLAEGATTVIVPTGGVEQNGPYVATGKHNYILRATTERIARRLGDALVAPIVELVPEGSIDPPSGHMRYPGTISLREETFEAVLTDVCASLRAHGFRHIVLLGDSGGNQKGMAAVAERLGEAWGATPTRVLYVPEYYNYRDLSGWLEQRGIVQGDDGIHDSFEVSAMLAAMDPSLIRVEQRRAKGLLRINGVDLEPLERTAAIGRELLDWRADLTVEAIRRRRAEPAASP